jgi:hypothetical protein
VLKAGQRSRVLLTKHMLISATRLIIKFRSSLYTVAVNKERKLDSIR